MKQISLCLIALSAVAFLTPVAIASGPVAAYALVDNVTIEPSPDKPERIRISGVFLTAQPKTDSYSEPQRGFLYLSLPANGADYIKREWNDLKTIAGTRQVVGLGSSWYAKQFRVRAPGEQPGEPDEYPVGNGLIKLNSDHPRAKVLLDYKGH